MTCARCGNKSEVIIDAEIAGSDLKQQLKVCRECVREGEKVHD